MQRDTMLVFGVCVCEIKDVRKCCARKIPLGFYSARPVKVSQFICALCYTLARPCHAENTCTRPTTAAKQHWEWLVLG
jgi:hypothetical protein